MVAPCRTFEGVQFVKIMPINFEKPRQPQKSPCLMDLSHAFLAGLSRMGGLSRNAMVYGKVGLVIPGYIVCASTRILGACSAQAGAADAKQTL
jgi:hypothetical protein